MPEPARALADWTWIPARIRSERAVVAVLLFAALALRVGAGFSGLVIQHDGSRFLKMTRLIDRAEFGRAMEIQPHMPPGYPLMIRLFALLFRDTGTAAVAVAALFGSLALLPLYALAKSIAGERIGAVAALIYAFLPDVFSLHGEVMSEGLFIFLFLSWMWLLWSASREPGWERFVLLGVCGGCAFLVRPEGIYTLLGTVGWLLVTAHRGWLKHAGGIAAFLVVFLVVASPYLLWVHATTGKWRFTVNPFAEGILDRLSGKTKAPQRPANPDSELKEERAQAKYGRVGGACVMVLREGRKVCFHVFLPVGLLGLVLAWRRFDRWGYVFLLLLILGYGLPTIVSMLTDQPFSYRYIMPSCLFATPFMAAGTIAILGWLSRVRWLPLVVSASVLIAMTVKGVKPRRADRLPLKQAGLWIREHHGPDRKIAAMDRRVEYYAEGDYYAVPQDLKDLPAEVEFLVAYDRQWKHYPPGFRLDVERRFREEARFGDVTVYSTAPSQR
ncbi:MAG: glycosyltransferase family 39 protein [Planctomycetes bacterium]|nr:glycosyltransferase family 39 protein [Planctomycetota bacterium]